MTHAPQRNPNTQQGRRLNHNKSNSHRQGVYGDGPKPLVGHIALVCNVPLRTTNTQLMEHFQACGDIIDIERRNYDAYVFYSTAQAAQKAVEERNGTILHDTLLAVSRGGAMTAYPPSPMVPAFPFGVNPWATPYVPQQQHYTSSPPVIPATASNASTRE